MIKGRLRSELRQPCCLVGRTDEAGQHQYSKKNSLMWIINDQVVYTDVLCFIAELV